MDGMSFLLVIAGLFFPLLFPLFCGCGCLCGSDKTVVLVARDLVFDLSRVVSVADRTEC